MEDNDGRKVIGHLPKLVFEKSGDPVVQVISEADGKILYKVRIQERVFRPPIFSDGKHMVKYGNAKPDGGELEGLVPSDEVIEIVF